MIALATNFRNATLSVDWPTLSSEMARVSATLAPKTLATVRSTRRLTADERTAICEARARGEKQIYLAALYGVDVGTIRRCCRLAPKPVPPKPPEPATGSCASR